MVNIQFLINASTDIYWYCDIFSQAFGHTHLFWAQLLLQYMKEAVHLNLLWVWKAALHIPSSHAW